VSNALRYGGAPVEISTSCQEEDKTITLHVRDHGPGINEADLPDLLQPFTRGNSARTNQGSGLGLAIVARITRMHNGKLDIQNHPEGGLIIQITFPSDKRPGRI
jgi:two-component system osmolarity sensor histidine kinase EnvZ